MNSIRTKVTSNIILEFEMPDRGYEYIVYGTVTVTHGRGRKKDVFEFIWNKSLDAYPVIRNRKYNKAEVEQLKSMVDFYSNLREVHK